ncbi:MAG: PilT/PilU family type 4a pilus ATPase [Proteobacteria bacterium]|jgi:twitching motility protein PilT|nr:PilT/PilU family type 4a pilus ATPase [Pseudomonadota bacterium]
MSEHPLPAHVDDYLNLGKQADASDIHLSVSSPPTCRRYGTLLPMWENAPLLTAEDTEKLVRGFLDESQLARLESQGDVDFAYTNSTGRYRTSVVRQRLGYDLAFRIISSNLRTLDELGMPPQLKLLTQYHNGLVLVTGPMGSGKTTTLAALVQEINLHRSDHIITLEEPIEYIIPSAGCQVTQREVHTHTKSFAAALRGALREDPDIIMVGEMRDLETIQLAISASETGHLVLGTLHTSNAPRTLDRLLDVFPSDQRDQIRIMVSESLRGIVSQQLIPRADGNGRAVAMEIMLNSPAIANVIREAKTFMLPGIIQTGKKAGMVLMDESVAELYRQGVITAEEALYRAENKAEMRNVCGI